MLLVVKSNLELLLDFMGDFFGDDEGFLASDSLELYFEAANEAADRATGRLDEELVFWTRVSIEGSPCVFLSLFHLVIMGICMTDIYDVYMMDYAYKYRRSPVKKKS